MDAPQGRAPLQAGPPPILMPSADPPWVKEHVKLTRRRRVESALAVLMLGISVALFAWML